MDITTYQQLGFVENIKTKQKQQQLNTRTYYNFIGEKKWERETTPPDILQSDTRRAKEHT